VDRRLNGSQQIIRIDSILEQHLSGRFFPVVAERNSGVFAFFPELTDLTVMLAP
jgi:hypothetical protein